MAPAIARAGRMSLSNLFCGVHRLIRIRRKPKISDTQNDVNFLPFSPKADGYTYVTEDALTGDACTQDDHAQDVHSKEARTETDSPDSELAETFSDAMDEFRELVERLYIDNEENDEQLRSPTVSKYATAIIALLVGPDETPFKVHQGFLEESGFFEACCNRGFLEMREKVVRIPEADPSDFAYLVDFLYAGNIPYHNYAANPISDLDVFTVQNIWYAPAWCPYPRYLHLWYPSSEHIHPVFRCTMFQEGWDEQSWESSHEKECVDEAREHLDLLLRLYELSDLYLFGGFREHILEHILHAANYCEPYDYFDAVCVLYDHPTELPDGFKEGIRKYIEFYFKATNKEIADELMQTMADKTHLAAEIINVMNRLLDEMGYLLESLNRVVRPWHVPP